MSQNALKEALHANMVFLEVNKLDGTVIRALQKHFDDGTIEFDSESGPSW